MNLVFGVMARAPVAGRCKTRLAKSLGAEGAKRLYEAMLRDRLAALSELTSRHVILAAPEDDGVAAIARMAPAWEVIAQRGADLGERLANALTELSSRDTMVCLIDSDSPTLPLGQIDAALRAPAPGREITLGPAADGGYYLVGSTVLEPRIFSGIPWSTARVSAATRARCVELGLGVRDLVTWYDVDEVEDLPRLARDLERDPLIAPNTRAVLHEVWHP